MGYVLINIMDSCETMVAAIFTVSTDPNHFPTLGSCHLEDTKQTYSVYNYSMSHARIHGNDCPHHHTSVSSLGIN